VQISRVLMYVSLSADLFRSDWKIFLSKMKVLAART
jgi:hypothetical protein